MNKPPPYQYVYFFPMGKIDNFTKFSFLSIYEELHMLLCTWYMPIVLCTSAWGQRCIGWARTNVTLRDSVSSGDQLEHKYGSGPIGKQSSTDAQPDTNFAAMADTEPQMEVEQQEEEEVVAEVSNAEEAASEVVEEVEEVEGGAESKEEDAAEEDAEAEATEEATSWISFHKLQQTNSHALAQVGKN